MARALPRGPNSLRLFPGAVLESASVSLLEAPLIHIARIIATFFYVGYTPKAPGTVGALVALPLAWFTWMLPNYLGWGLVAVLFLLGAWSAQVVINHTGQEDDQTIVMDEVVGILVTTSVATQLWWQYALAFLIFRMFDILKPGPIGLVDARVKGGFGAMADDFVAALMAAATLYLVLLFSARMVAPIGV
jgi:phosphatidylglycerophosphatase A